MDSNFNFIVITLVLTIYMYFVVLKAKAKGTIVLDHFHIISTACNVKPEDRPRIVTPVVAIMRKKPLLELLL